MTTQRIMTDIPLKGPDTPHRQVLYSLFRETWQTSWELIRITIPVAILTKLCEELGLIHYISAILEPIMGMIGLPGPLGLVWATAMLTNLYGGIAVFAALAPGLELTAAQVTVLCSAMLIAHGLPVELSVSKRAGANLLPIGAVRVLGALAYAYLLNGFCLLFSIWQAPASLLFKVPESEGGLVAWSLNQLQNQGLIILIIFCIIISMRLFKIIGLLTLLEKLLAPVLPLFGMGRHAAPLTVVGMVMGLSYGGALIIRETASGKMDRREVFNSMALMGLCHGLVEDTLIMAAIGGKFSGIFWGRVLFSLIVISMMVKISGWFAGRRRLYQSNEM
ncbi:MAG: hypothetical protein ACN4GW_13675 [Desulforhopalus sp.]